MEPFQIPGELVEHILLGPADDRRVLQDSPILGDVWLAYAADPASDQDLLITPHRDATAAEVAGLISAGVKALRKGTSREKKSPKVAYLQGIVAARLYFDEVLRILVPTTQWWTLGRVAQKLAKGDRREIGTRMGRLLNPARFQAISSLGTGRRTDIEHEDFTALDRYIALVGLILWLSTYATPDEPPPKLDSIKDVFARYEPRLPDIVAGLLKFYDTLQADLASSRLAGKSKEDREPQPVIFQISLNRRATAALEKSIPAVKGDAALKLFEVKCSKIVWAVLDSGIDRDHSAFSLADADPPTRIRRTFDFTNIREIVSGDYTDRNDLVRRLLAHNKSINSKEAHKRLSQIADDAENKRPTNWDVVEELITLSDPPKPPSPHGTHVGGIIGAARVDSGPAGMCQDIRLYDFRVLGRTMEDTEFAVIAALQYIRYVNDKHSDIRIHGANLSLSIPHNVRNYACGRTPVCIECERLVDNGVVVVAAAGNRGHQKFETKEGIFESYAAFSITDPGNGDGVITVGATHGNWPQTYGISFFSSRGPTGDGRLKPDLVAPGERIQSTIPNNDWGPESGTSMAAPHVSGAAAMLMGRYPELIGQPRRIKRILCETATDLGRERTFQGAGMLDVLRALQSI
jgi:hypothetical protein